MSSIQDALRKAQKEREATHLRPRLADSTGVTPKRNRKRLWLRGWMLIGASILLAGGGAGFLFQEEISSVKARVMEQVRGPTSVPGAKAAPSKRRRTVKTMRKSAPRRVPSAPPKSEASGPRPKRRTPVAKRHLGSNFPRAAEDKAATNAPAPKKRVEAAAQQPLTLDEARRLRELGDLKGAEAILKSVIEEAPERIDAIIALANLYLGDLGAPQRAYSLYRRALAMDPTRASLHVNLGAYYLRMGDLAKAKEHTERALRLAPKMAEVHYNLACIQAVSGDRQRAEEALKRAVAIDPRCAQWAREDPDLASLRDGRAAAGGRGPGPRQSHP